MAQVLILSLFIPVAVLPILILLRVSSELRNHYLFVSIFTNQLLLIFVIGYKPAGVNEGGSIFANIIILYSSVLPLSVLILTRPATDNNVEKRNLSLNEEILKFSWIFILLMATYGAILARTKLMPISNVVIFASLVYLIMHRVFNFEMLLIAIYRVFSLFAALLTLSFILGFDWGAVVTREIEALNLDRNVYFSPLGAFFGFAPRAFGPFGSGQVSGMFSVFGIACYLSSSKPKKSVFPIIALVAFGSCSGSRTFYLTLISIVMYRLFRKIMPRNATAFWLILPIFSGSIGYFLFKHFLPIISPEKASLENLTGRSDLWKLVLSDWSKEGLFGHGPDSLSQYAMDHLYLNYAHAHNSFLQYLWDFGLLGIFTFCAMIISICVESSRNYEKRDQVFTLVLTLLCVESEPTLIVGMGVVTWFWLVPLTYAYSNDRPLREQR